jgi:hypothetical protein
MGGFPACFAAREAEGRKTKRGYAVRKHVFGGLGYFRHAEVPSKQSER